MPIESGARLWMERLENALDAVLAAHEAGELNPGQYARLVAQLANSAAKHLPTKELQERIEQLEELTSDIRRRERHAVGS